MNTSEIKNIAEDVRLNYHDKKIPIDVRKICKKMDIKIIECNLSEVEKQVKRTISGLIVLDTKTKKETIYVNDKDNEPRRNFTIAHELGHHFLHIKDDVKDIVVSFRGLKNKTEREADIFAAELLMPKELVISEYRKLPFPTANYLSGLFDVSILAMKYRLKELELDYIG